MLPFYCRHDNFGLLQVIGARHLMKSGRGYVSPFVEIEIVGLDCDCNKFKTITIRKLQEAILFCVLHILHRDSVLDNYVTSSPNISNLQREALLREELYK